MPRLIYDSPLTQAGLLRWFGISAGTVMLLLVLFSCRDTPAKSVHENAVNQSAMDLDPRLKTIDSLVVVFYDDPFGPDSLRYTRFYKQISATPGDSLSSQLMNTYTKGEKRSCRGEGKIWCYGEGKITQTLYFSTRCEQCCFVYLIKDGNFYFANANTEFLSWLQMQKGRLQG